MTLIYLHPTRHKLIVRVEGLRKTWTTEHISISVTNEYPIYVRSMLTFVISPRLLWKRHFIQSNCLLNYCSLVAFWEQDFPHLSFEDIEDGRERLMSLSLNSVPTHTLISSDISSSRKQVCLHFDSKPRTFMHSNLIFIIKCVLLWRGCTNLALSFCFSVWGLLCVCG